MLNLCRTVEETSSCAANRAEYNVAGMKSENSQEADVYQNTSTNKRRALRFQSARTCL